MAPFPANARGVARLATPVLATLVLLTSGASLLAQATNVSVTSQISHGCGTAIAAAMLQRDIETQLRNAGLVVSRVPSAKLTTNLDCVPVSDQSRSAGMAVHQCLALSQVVSVPSQADAMTMATTWQQCQSYTCAGRHCADYAQTSQRSLVDTFLAVEHERSADLPVRAANIGLAGTPLRVDQVFYGLYILICLGLVVRWGTASRPAVGRAAR